MSSGLECVFIEPERGRWYYVIQQHSCPVGAWDWREYADCFGPFQSYEYAGEHLRQNHANTGGHSIEAHEDFRPSKMWDALIASAEKVPA